MHTFEKVFPSQSFKSALPSVQHPLSPHLPHISQVCAPVCVLSSKMSSWPRSLFLHGPYYVYHQAVVLTITNFMSVSPSVARYHVPLFTTETPTPSPLLSRADALLTDWMKNENQSWKTDHKFPKPENSKRLSLQIPREKKKRMSDVLFINHY